MTFPQFLWWLVHRTLELHTCFWVCLTYFGFQYLLFLFSWTETSGVNYETRFLNCWCSCPLSIFDHLHVCLLCSPHDILRRIGDRDMNAIFYKRPGWSLHSHFRELCFCTEHTSYKGFWDDNDNREKSLFCLANLSLPHFLLCGTSRRFSPETKVKLGLYIS